MDLLTTPQRQGPIECLGQTFLNEQARREHFLKLLAEKLKDPVFRTTEGFPQGTDEAILAMSDPPYYTACPNPFLGEFVRRYGKPYDPSVSYSREPMAVDVSEGKNDPIYKAHSYHTKVPHLAIIPSILHYTEPGDLVLDGFAGSGMTGVAAQWCESAPASYRREIEALRKAQGRTAPKWGPRGIILNDLSPAATFIAANYNLPLDIPRFCEEADAIIKQLRAELGQGRHRFHSMVRVIQLPGVHRGGGFSRPRTRRRWKSQGLLCLPPLRRQPQQEESRARIQDCYRRDHRKAKETTQEEARTHPVHERIWETDQKGRRRRSGDTRTYREAALSKERAAQRVSRHADGAGGPHEDNQRDQCARSLPA